MSNRISWTPNVEGDIASYNLEKAVASIGPFTLLVNIPHNLLGPNYYAPDNEFFYIDAVGGSSDWYRITAIDTAAQLSSPSLPFQPAAAPSPLASSVKVDHNYGGVNALAYYTAGGYPIDGALVRAYLKTEFDLGHTDSPLFITQTNADGKWVNPFYLATGYTYVIQFVKEGLYGPDKTEIVV